VDRATIQGWVKHW